MTSATARRFLFWSDRSSFEDDFGIGGNQKVFAQRYDGVTRTALSIKPPANSYSSMPRHS